MKISGGFVCNGAKYLFTSLEGDFKWVYGELLKYMKKWSVPLGDIFVDDEKRYTVFVCAKCILLYRCNDGHVCSFRREG